MDVTERIMAALKSTVPGNLHLATWNPGSKPAREEVVYSKSVCKANKNECGPCRLPINHAGCAKNQ